MREFLIEMFEINKDLNLKMISSVQRLNAPEESLVHLSHLANCQYKWLDRLKVFPEDSMLDWWNPVYNFDDLPQQFIDSTDQWIEYLSDSVNNDIESEKNYIGYDGSLWNAKLKDITLQLIFHSFHHRAQIQMLIRAQSQRPAFIDYIGYKSKKNGTT